MRRRIQNSEGHDVHLRVSSLDIDVAVRGIVVRIVYLELESAALLVENGQSLDSRDSLIATLPRYMANLTYSGM